MSMQVFKSNRLLYYTFLLGCVLLFYAAGMSVVRWTFQWSRHRIHWLPWWCL